MKRCRVCQRIIGSTIAVYTPDARLMRLCKDCLQLSRETRERRKRAALKKQAQDLDAQRRRISHMASAGAFGLGKRR